MRLSRIVLAATAVAALVMTTTTPSFANWRGGWYGGGYGYGYRGAYGPRGVAVAVVATPGYGSYYPYYPPAYYPSYGYGGYYQPAYYPAPTYCPPRYPMYHPYRHRVHRKICYCPPKTRWVQPPRASHLPADTRPPRPSHLPAPGTIPPPRPSQLPTQPRDMDRPQPTPYDR